MQSFAGLKEKVHLFSVRTSLKFFPGWLSYGFGRLHRHAFQPLAVTADTPRAADNLWGRSSPHASNGGDRRRIGEGKKRDRNTEEAHLAYLPLSPIWLASKERYPRSWEWCA